MRRFGSQHVNRNFIFSTEASRLIVRLPCLSYKEFEQISGAVPH